MEDVGGKLAAVLAGSTVQQIGAACEGARGAPHFRDPELRAQPRVSVLAAPAPLSAHRRSHQAASRVQKG